MTQAPGNAEFRQVSLTELHESPLNPRRHWPEGALRELSDSIYTVGILTPLLVRSTDTGLEIAAGHRRFRAAKMAGVTTVPVLVRTMTDQEFMEVLTIENLHREDIHPMDEAESYRCLMHTLSYDVPTLAGKVEKSESYIYQRLKLLELIKPAQEAFLQDEFTVGHAVLIARLQPHDQQRVMKECVTTMQGVHWGQGPKGMVSVKHLEGFIRTEIMLDLHKVGFKKDDPTLVSKAGACTECPKRTGFNQSLFHDLQKADLCTDGTCYNAKLDAHLKQKQENLEASGATVIQIVDGACSYEETQKHKEAVRDWDIEKVGRKSKIPAEDIHVGLIVAGPNRGKTMKVAKPKAGKRFDGRTPQEIGRERAQRRKEKINQAVRDDVYQQVVAKATALDPAKHGEELRMIASTLWARWYHNDKQRYCQLMGIEVKPEKCSWSSQLRKDYDGAVNKLIPKMSSTEALGFMLRVVLLGSVQTGSTQKPDRLVAVAKRLGLPMKAMEQQVRESFDKKPSPKKPPPKKTVGKKKKATTRTKTPKAAA